MPIRKPKVFIGSSAEQLDSGRAINHNLDRDAECIVWTHGFRPGTFSLEALEDEIGDSDFTVFVFRADDVVTSRRKSEAAVRDNVLLEIGISIGVMSRRRTFLILERTERAKIPTDLLGLTPITFERRENLSAALEPACQAMRREFQLQGLRPRHGPVVIPHRYRSATSIEFAKSTLRTLSIFAGDVSWLESDLKIYQYLVNERNVRVRFLTDKPTAPVIKKAKDLGLLFRAYPGGRDAPFRASISDAETESDARALVVKRTVPRPPPRDGSPYDYLMKEYRATENEFSVITAMALLFEHLWNTGEPL